MKWHYLASKFQMWSVGNYGAAGSDEKNDLGPEQ